MDNEAYLTTMRELYRKDLGSAVDIYSVDDFISDLAEDGFPDAHVWLAIWGRLFNGGELTDRERDQAVAYYKAGAGYPSGEFVFTDEEVQCNLRENGS